MTDGPATAVHAGLIGVAAHGIVTKILSPITDGAGALAGLGLAAVAAWVLGGAKASLIEAARAINLATAPDLTHVWFSTTYWRVAGLAALITIPFLCAAAIQALMRSDISLVIQSALVYLPLSLLGVSLAAPVVMLLLSATDGMCSVVAGAGVDGGASFLRHAAIDAGGLATLDGSPFFAVVVGLFTAVAAVALTVELLVREAAVYIVVLMLPLVFAGLVWPARRIWAVRVVELLVGLILSKFVIVAVLSLAGAAFNSGDSDGGSGVLTAMALVLLSTMAPWAMLRLLPFTELAAGAADALSSRGRGYVDPAQMLLSAVDPALDWTAGVSGLLRRDADSGESSPIGGGADATAHGGRTRSGAGSVTSSDDALQATTSRHGRASEDAWDSYAAGVAMQPGLAADGVGAELRPLDAEAQPLSAEMQPLSAAESIDGERSHVTTAPTGPSAGERPDATASGQSPPGSGPPDEPPAPGAAAGSAAGSAAGAAADGAGRQLPPMAEILQAENGAFPPVWLGPGGVGRPTGLGAPVGPAPEPTIGPVGDDPVATASSAGRPDAAPAPPAARTGSFREDHHEPDRQIDRQEIDWQEIGWPEIAWRGEGPAIVAGPQGSTGDGTQQASELHDLEAGLGDHDGASAGTL